MKQMVKQGELIDVLQCLKLEGLELRPNEPLSAYTRFGIGGPADLLVTVKNADSFVRTLEATRASELNWVVIGGGTNLIVADAGFRGVVLRFAGNGICFDGHGNVFVEAGAVLQDLVDGTVAQGLQGLETMTGIPGWAGAAVYGNAGAYGHSLSERVQQVAFFDGTSERLFDNAQCEFRYRESIFKKQKDWIITHCTLRLDRADAAELQTIADGILKIRNDKYPPTMKCAGSIFKNYLFADLPPAVQAMVPRNLVREGKVPSAWFLEQVGAKGIRRGDIAVATYHANLIYNDGAGTARDLAWLIRDLKTRIEDRFGMPLEEEVQYVGDFTVM